MEDIGVDFSKIKIYLLINSHRVVEVVVDDLLRILLRILVLRIDVLRIVLFLAVVHKLCFAYTLSRLKVRQKDLLIDI